MQLYDAGLLDVRASICTYLEQCPPTWGSITVHHLLTHTSGLPNYTDFASFPAVETSPVTPDQLVARFRDMPLNFTPGAAFQYCNSNYVLLGRIIERISGMTYADYVGSRIFAPLNMRDSGYDPGDAGILQGTRGYAGTADAIPIDTSNLYAAGGLYSTVEDLFRLSRALDEQRLIRPELYERMYTAERNNYAYGWKAETRYGLQVVYHPGLMSGAATHYERYPQIGLTIVVLSNDEYVNVGAIANYIAQLLLNPGN
jgi:CubicO group peptidase (beta-lactamase class C family)